MMEVLFFLIALTLVVIIFTAGYYRGLKDAEKKFQAELCNIQRIYSRKIRSINSDLLVVAENLSDTKVADEPSQKSQ